MIKEYTCIMCPNGCEVEAEIEGSTVISIVGASCTRGKEYVEQELIDPQRNIATSVVVENGNIRLASVRLTNAISKNKIFDVMNEIKKIRLTAPVEIGQIVIKNVLELKCDVIATKKVGVKLNS